MDRIAITGGARLEGVIPISGAKNSAIKLMVASLLTDQPLRLTNMPRLADTRFLGRLLQRLGVDVQESDGPDGPQTVLRTPEILGAIAPYDLVRQMRASFNVLGPLLARCGEARVALPGGDMIGSRKVDMHLRGLEYNRFAYDKLPHMIEYGCDLGTSHMNAVRAYRRLGRKGEAVDEARMAVEHCRRLVRA